MIGHLSPLGGPISGGTVVTVNGINFDGGEKYKCKFDQVTVPGTYNSTTGTITCTTPPITIASSRHEVDFRIAIFFSEDHQVHHFASHHRKFTYYGKLSLLSLFEYLIT